MLGKVFFITFASGSYNSNDKASMVCFNEIESLINLSYACPITYIVYRIAVDKCYCLSL